MADELGRQYFSTFSPDPSESSTHPTAYQGTTSSTRHRPTYQRLASGASFEHTSQTIPEDAEGEDISNTIRRGSSGVEPGLGIATGASPPTPKRERRVSIQSIPRVAVGSRMTSPREMTTPGSDGPTSPPNLSNLSTPAGTAYDAGAYDSAPFDSKQRYHGSASSLGAYQPVYDQSETVPLTKNIAPSIRSTRSTRSTRSKYDSTLNDTAVSMVWS